MQIAITVFVPSQTRRGEQNATPREEKCDAGAVLPSQAARPSRYGDNRRKTHQFRANM
jgi:hypothetical protein